MKNAVIQSKLHFSMNKQSSINYLKYLSAGDCILYTENTGINDYDGITSKQKLIFKPFLK